MPGFESPMTVLLRVSSNVKLSAIRQLFPSITVFKSHRRSERGDDNLDEAEWYLQVTKKQLDKIYNASQEANRTYEEEIIQIEDRLQSMDFEIKTIKMARESTLIFGKTLQRLGDDAETKNLLEAARQLSKKAKRTSARVTLADSPTSSNNQSMANISGLGFLFHEQPTADDGKKIDCIIRLVDSCSDDDNTEELESVRVLRPRKSVSSTYSYHSEGSDAYKTGESNVPSSSTSGQLLPQSRSSCGMLLGSNATFQQCNFYLSNMQSNDSCTVSDATANLGVIVVGRSHPCTPIQPAVDGSPCPYCSDPRGVEAMQTRSTLCQDAVADDMPSVSERHSPAAPSQNGIPAVPTMQPLSSIHPDGAGIQQTLPLSTGAENIQSHSMIIDGSPVVLSPTMNINSPGAMGATNTYLSDQPIHCPALEGSAPSQSLEVPSFRCGEVCGNSVA